MFVRSRAQIVSTSLILAFAAGTLTGCRKDKPTPAVVKPDKATIQRSYEELGPQLKELEGTFSGLRKQLESVPDDLPGMDTIRGKLLSAEEVLGVTAARFTWLAGELSSALQGGKAEQLETVSKQIAATGDEVKQIQRVGLELTHQLLPYRRMAALQAKPVLGFSRVLPTSYKVEAADQGAEQQLLALIEDPKHKVEAPKGKLDLKSWIVLDRLYFANASPELDSERSRAQLENVLEILKAYPGVRIQIGGFTDDSGPTAASKKLSFERAQAVKNELARLGVSTSRVEVEGFGAEHPACMESSSPDCKAKNQRVALRVIKK